MATDVSLRKILRQIDEYGWAVMGVGGGACDTPGCDGGPDDDGIEFAYTIGLSTLGFPEIITYGLPQQVAHACLNFLGQRVIAGKPPKIGCPIEQVFRDSRGYLIDVADTSDLVVVGQIYPETVATQLIWPDWRGRFPWESGYNRWRYPQPLMGPPPARRAG